MAPYIARIRSMRRAMSSSNPRDSFLKAFWHLPLGVVRPVSVLDQSHQRAHQCYYSLLPPDSRQSHDLRDDFDLSALLEPLALPRGHDLHSKKRR